MTKLTKPFRFRSAPTSVDSVPNGAVFGRLARLWAPLGLGWAPGTWPFSGRSGVPVGGGPKMAITFNAFVLVPKISNSSKTEQFRSILGHGLRVPFSGPASIQDCVRGSGSAQETEGARGKWETNGRKGRRKEREAKGRGRAGKDFSGRPNGVPPRLHARWNCALSPEVTLSLGAPYATPSHGASSGAPSG